MGGNTLNWLPQCKPKEHEFIWQRRSAARVFNEWKCRKCGEEKDTEA